MSAGMGAVVWGCTLLGPSAGVAAADVTGDSSVASPQSVGEDGPDSAEAESAGPSDVGDADEDDAADEADEADEAEVDIDVLDDADENDAADSDISDPVDDETADDESPSDYSAVTEMASATSAAMAAAPEDTAGIAAVPEPPAVATRRTLRNQAPTVTPVQLSGRISGPITGTLGAVDPDGDPIVYKVLRAPREGTVVIADDGSYVYTPNDAFDGVDKFRIIAVDDTTAFKLFRPGGTRANLLINQAAIAFEFSYGAGAQYWTADRREALQEAADQLLLYLLVNQPVTLTYTVTGEDDEDSDSLAAAGSNLSNGRPGYWPTVVGYKIQTGRDANGAAPDGQIDWNFGYPWASGGIVGPDEYDFDRVVLHELLHSAGFLSTVDQPGDNARNTRSAFDRFIVTAGGAKPIGLFFRWKDVYDPYLTGANGGLFFGGANAVAAYGGPVPLYTPNPWVPGSSMSHLDDDTFTGADNQVMNSMTGVGSTTRTLSSIELGILTDLGFQVTPLVPEPTLALLPVVLIAGKRRRRHG